MPKESGNAIIIPNEILEEIRRSAKTDLRTLENEVVYLLLLGLKGRDLDVLSR